MTFCSTQSASHAHRVATAKHKYSRLQSRRLLVFPRVRLQAARVVRVLLQRDARADDEVHEHGEELGQDAHAQVHDPAALRAVEFRERRAAGDGRRLAGGRDAARRGRESGEHGVGHAHGEEGERAGDAGEQLWVGRTCQRPLGSARRKGKGTYRTTVAHQALPVRPAEEVHEEDEAEEDCEEDDADVAEVRARVHVGLGRCGAGLDAARDGERERDNAKETHEAEAASHKRVIVERALTAGGGAGVRRDHEKRKGPGAYTV